MGRFAGAFKRKSSMPEEPAAPSFRVLDRADVAAGNFTPPAKAVTSPDGFRNLTSPSAGRHLPDHGNADLYDEDENIFAGMKRGSGSSTTKTASTDTSSRHSGISTAPSSAAHISDGDDHHKQHGVPKSSLPKSSTTGGLLSRAGRTFSFGSNKRGNEDDVTSDSVPPVPQIPTDHVEPRPRGMTASTTTTALTTSTAGTATPPRVGDRASRFDLGSDFGSMFGGYDEEKKGHASRNSISTVTGRSLTSNVPQQPDLRPLHIDRNAKVEMGPFSSDSRNSSDGLLRNTSPRVMSPVNNISNQVHRNVQQPSHNKTATPPPEPEDEDTALLRESLMASSILTEKLDEVPVRGPANVSTIREAGEDNMFDSTASTPSRRANRYQPTRPNAGSRVMTPAEFEKFKKERGGRSSYDKNSDKDDDDDEINYDDDEDDVEKAKALSKQRKKQEAHMAVYRQKMMKVTGEAAPGPRPPVVGGALGFGSQPPSPNAEDDDPDEDEEVPLAILAAHGFPNKNKPPARLTEMSSNPNLRQSLQPSYQRPGSASGQQQQAPGGGPLPAFARNLPQDPFVGAGLVRHAPRESLSMGGGAQLPPVGNPGGLVGIIANEERAKAMRRGGSPDIEANAARNSMFAPQGLLAGQMANPAGVGYNGMGQQQMSPQGFGMASPPMNGAGMMGMGGGMNMGGNRSSMYSMGGSPSMPQLAMNGQDQMAQMQQLMQMQMQFMQMQMQMNAQQVQATAGGMRPMSTVGSIAGMPMMDNRMSFMGPDMSSPAPRMDNSMRTMSMVAPPTNGSWMPKQNFAPSIRMQGGYTPSIAPSERSNIGLPGRYRPVSQLPAAGEIRRVSSMMDVGAGLNIEQNSVGLGMNRAATASPGKLMSGGVHEASASEDEDEDEGWEAMKAKREAKRSLWKNKKELKDIGALIL